MGLSQLTALELLIENSKIEIAFSTHCSSGKDSTNLVEILKTKLFFPKLYEFGQEILIEKSIPKETDRIIDRFGEINNDASDLCSNSQRDGTSSW